MNMKKWLDSLSLRQYMTLNCCVLCAAAILYAWAFWPQGCSVVGIGSLEPIDLLAKPLDRN